MAFSTTLSSVGISPALALNPQARATITQLSFTGTSSADVVIQATLDDVVVGQTQSWTSLSTTHYSSTSIADGVLITVLAPVAGLRLSSSTFTAATAGNFVTLKALQTISAG